MPAPAPRPPARANHSAAIVDGTMIIYGGSAGGAPLNNPWVFDPQTMTWSRKTTVSTPPGLQFHSAVVSGGQMYIVGGTDGSGMPSAEVWAYSPTANSWTQKADYPGPFGGAYGTAVLAPDSTIIVGGTTGSEYFVYEPQTNTWSQKTATTGFPDRVSPGTAQVGDYGYIFGGKDATTGWYPTDAWRSDLKQDPINWGPELPDMPNHKAPVILIPEVGSPTGPISWPQHWLAAPEQGSQPVVLLFGRSWTYDPDKSIPIPIYGDAVTWAFWPTLPAAGPLAGISVSPEAATVPAGTKQLFTAYGQDVDGYYVPITPTWGAPAAPSAISVNTPPGIGQGSITWQQWPRLLKARRCGIKSR